MSPCSRMARSAGYCANHNPIHARTAGNVPTSSGGSTSHSAGQWARWIFATGIIASMTVTPQPSGVNRPTASHMGIVIRARLIRRLCRVRHR